MENSNIQIMSEEQVEIVSGGNLDLLIESGATGSVLGAMGGAIYNGAAGAAMGAGSGLALGGAFAFGYGLATALGARSLGSSLGGYLHRTRMMFPR